MIASASPLTLPNEAGFTGQGAAPLVGLLMSGGVDSTVAALLMRQQGWSLAGLTLCIPGFEGEAIETGEAAARTASELGIPHKIIRADRLFSERVIEPFLRSYREGKTPNPCADCNRSVKFGLLMDEAENWLGSSVPIATGHYARILRRGDRVYLASAVDKAKDQSYFLCDIEPERLKRLYFPLGELTKPQVRELAREFGLEVAERPDSMEVCFLAGTDYRKKYFSEEPGDILDEHGKVLGRHGGLFGYTVGQRQGLGIAAPHPLYVLRLDAVNNTLIVGGRQSAFVRTVRAASPNVMAPDMVDGCGEKMFMGKTRSRSPLSPCTIQKLDGHELIAVFKEAQFAPAAGQRLVLYDGDILAVSGVITC